MWWNSSNQTCIILNVDGNCLGNSIKVGYGGLLSHQIGCRISSFLDYIACTFDNFLGDLHPFTVGSNLLRKWTFKKFPTRNPSNVFKFLRTQLLDFMSMLRCWRHLGSPQPWLPSFHWSHPRRRRLVHIY